jgi:hypothetical protein
MTLDDKKQALSNQIDDVRDSLSTLINGVDPNVVIHQDTGWRLHDVLAHILAWEQDAVEACRGHIAGEPDMPMRDIPRFNDAAYQEWRGRAWSEVYAAWWGVYDTLKDVVTRIPADRWDVEFVNSWGAMGTLAFTVRAILAHDAEHIVQIREALGEH